MDHIARFSNHEILKEVVSLLIKLSSGWRQPQKDGNTKANIDGTRDPILPARLMMNLKIYKVMASLVGKLSSFWCQPQKDENSQPNIEELASPLLEKYKVTQDLVLIWGVDIVAQDSLCIQVLKILDIIPATKFEEVSKILMKKAYGNYNETMMSRCKEKCVDGYV